MAIANCLPDGSTDSLKMEETLQTRQLFSAPPFILPLSQCANNRPHSQTVDRTVKQSLNSNKSDYQGLPIILKADQ